jgi:type I restriction enzyme M protein
LGSKRNELATDHIQQIQDMYFAFEESEHCKIFDNEDFGFYQITVHQPEKNEKGKIVLDSKGKHKSDSSLKDIENVLMRGVGVGRDKVCLVSTLTICDEYFKREVLPFAPDAWYDKTKMKVGYEIAFNKYFYQYEGLRSLQDIANDILKLEQETDGLLKEIIA